MKTTANIEKRIEETLKGFGVSGKVVNVCFGPVITQYEFKLDSGTKIAKVTTLEDELAMGLCVESVRMNLLPSKGVIGIEVPNAERQMVSLLPLLKSEEMKGKALPLVIGVDVEGNDVVADLTKMPHLLMAGATGAGKSVAINAMITSMITNVGPEALKMIMIDPKMLELAVYEGIPHLLFPVVTDSKKAVNVLKWVTEEMDRRYQVMSQTGTRNIAGYNEVAAEHLPYIVVVVDEFADLMMVAGKEVEESVTRLAQKSRAAGIHMILGTQRPSVDVITGTIKANFPARIAFRVASKVDSRIVLDSNGAETLLGKGDMLFSSPSEAKVFRCHGAFVSDNEVAKIVSETKKIGTPAYHMDLTEKAASEATVSAENMQVMLEEHTYMLAVDYVSSLKDGKLSLFALKTKLGISNAWATRIMERMEREGIVTHTPEVAAPQVTTPAPFTFKGLLKRLTGF